MQLTQKQKIFYVLGPIYLKKFNVITERFSLSDFNRQIVIDLSTHETEGLARIFSFNFLGISGFSLVFLYFKVPTKTIASFTVCPLAYEFTCSDVICVYYG